MHVPHPPRSPQRVVVTGPAGPAHDAFVARLAAALDLPLVGAADLVTGTDVHLLLDFDGWTLVVGADGPDPRLLGRAELVVHAVPETTGALRGLVRRARRRLLADDAGDVPAWFVAAELARPEAAVRLDGPDAVETWLATLAR